LIIEIVTYAYYFTVCHRQHFRAVAGVVMHVGEITVDESALFIHPHPVDGETLRIKEGTINA